MTERWQQSSGEQDEDFKPLTREQARQWRGDHPQVSARQVVIGQWLLSLVVVVLIWPLAPKAAWVVEMLYGVVAMVLPSTVMAWALGRNDRSGPGRENSALAGFFFWEGVKLLMAIVLMALTPWWFASPSWLALLVGVLVALKAHALVAWWLTVRLGRLRKVQ